MIRKIIISVILAVGLSACIEHNSSVKPNPYGNWRDSEYVPALSQRTDLRAGFYPGETVSTGNQTELAAFRSANFKIISEIETKLSSNAPLWCIKQPVSSCVAALAREFVVLTSGRHIVRPMETDLLGKPLFETLSTVLHILPPFVGKAPYTYYRVSITSDPEGGGVTSVSMEAMNGITIRSFNDPQKFRDMKLQQFFESVAPPICKFGSEEEFFRFLATQLFVVKRSPETFVRTSDDASMVSMGTSNVKRCGQVYTFTSLDGHSVRRGSYTTGNVGVRKPYHFE